MVLYIGIYIESDWLYHAEWVALSNGQSGSELAEYSKVKERRSRCEKNYCKDICVCAFYMSRLPAELCSRRYAN